MAIAATAAAEDVLSSSSSSSLSDIRPVIVITGANSGVGFGIAQRLLVQLSSPTPSDTLPTHPHLTPRDVQRLPSPFAAPRGCTIVLACRNAIKAHRARAQLLNLLNHLEELPDEADTPLHVPRSVLDQAIENKINGSIDEDADPALVAQAMEASLRRRRRRNAAISNAEEMELSDERSLTRDPRTGRVYSMREREAKARGRYRRRFCAGTKIEIQALDLGSMASALQCAKDVTTRYKYVTHVILNAGSSAFTGINWPRAIWMVLTRLHAAVTYPTYKMQRAGDIGKDGYGWVWQANVGAHYILVRALLPALRSTPYSTPSRIIWTGSLEAYESSYDPSDYQCIDAAKSIDPYGSSKYQCELAAHGLEDVLNGRRIRTEPGTPLLEDSKSLHESRYFRDHNGSSDRMEPKSFLTHPGVVASSIFAECLNAFMAASMQLLFYIARWTFSQHHNIEGYKGAAAASHVALAPLPKLDPSARYGSQSDWHGREYVYCSDPLNWTATSPKGLGKDKKAAILERAINEANHGPPARHGEYVKALSRDLIVKLEGVAKSVWGKAQDGDLPPFMDFLTDGDTGDDADDDYEAESGGRKRATARRLSSQLLPKRNGVIKASGVDAMTTLGGKDVSIVASARTPGQKNGSMNSSSQDEWERVDRAL